ncbi:TetR/AcrR family transcriptional regulator [Planctomycetota bacterium]|nr:TetR/AcrR family transcriptional regulator [Planctomycetota bacterium]
MSYTKDSRAERHMSLVLSALKVFAEHGIDGASIADIADEAGVAKGSIYLYFDSKDALAGDVMRHVFHYDVDIENPLLKDDPNPLERILAFAQRQENRILALGKEASIVLHMFGHIGKGEHDQIGRGISQFMRESVFGCKALLENAITRGDLPADCDSKAIAEQVVAATYGAIHQRISVSSTAIDTRAITVAILLGHGARL